MTAEKSRLFRAINWKKSNIVQCQAVSGSVSTILSAGLMNLYTVEHVVMPHTSHHTPQSLRVTIMDILTNHLQPSRLIRVQCSVQTVQGGRWTSKYFPEMNI